VKDMDRAIKACVAAGLVYDRGRKHAKITYPKTGRSISVSVPPSCVHAPRNMLRDVRKYLGVKVKL